MKLKMSQLLLTFSFFGNVCLSMTLTSTTMPIEADNHNIVSFDDTAAGMVATPHVGTSKVRLRIIKNRLIGSSSLISYFGLFDGHGSSDAVAEYLNNNFHELVKDEIIKCAKIKHSSIYASDVVKQGLSNAFEAAHNFICQQRRMCNYGSSALVIIMIDDVLYVANVGDSRAVFINENTIFPLNATHKPDTDSKRDAIAEWLVNEKGVKKINAQFYCYFGRTHKMPKAWRFSGCCKKSSFPVYRGIGSNDNLCHRPDIVMHKIDRSTLLFMASNDIWNTLWNKAEIFQSPVMENAQDAEGTFCLIDGEEVEKVADEKLVSLSQECQMSPSIMVRKAIELSLKWRNSKHAAAFAIKLN